MFPISSRIILIGAANRVELADHIIEAGRNSSLNLSLLAVEASTRSPIATRANVATTNLSFPSSDFTEFLVENFSSPGDVILPLMDSSIASVFGASSSIVTPVTKSSVSVLDKKHLKSLCATLGVQTPEDVRKGIAHVRPIFGNGSKGISVVDLDSINTHLDHSFYLYEEVLDGKEVSVDTYVFQDGTYSAIARERLRVVGGEVQHTLTRDLSDLERKNVEALLLELNLRGPLNFQFMGEDSKLLEINPRFGGGSTASIKAGWLANHWLLEEYCLGNPMTSPKPFFNHVEVIRAWKDYVWR